MNDTKRKQYLQALGVTTWLPKSAGVNNEVTTNCEATVAADETSW
jgi:hypothetical protein